MRKFLNGFGVAAAMIIASWAWRGAPVAMPPAPLGAGEKLHCVSYAPFRGAQSPLDPGLRIPLTQLEEDLTALAHVTECVRIYAVDMGLEAVPAIAEKVGLKVLLGIWISGTARHDRAQMKTAIALARRYPGTIRAVVVGNEVLLRGDLDADPLAELLREVKAKVSVPVTYADVWEFWLRHPALAEAVDFVTVHILPYWEDEPVRAELAADHVRAVHARVAQAFSSKDILIGEAGWPSAGRMREAALPSPVNQARVIHELTAASRAGSFRVNLIEAFNQPWKRHQEGTVGGAWGVFSGPRTAPRVAWGQTVSNAPWWPWAATGGLVFGALIFLAGGRAAGAPGAIPNRQLQLQLTVLAAVAGSLAGTVIEAALLEARGLGGGLRSWGWVAVSLALPMTVARSLGAGVPMPTLADALENHGHRPNPRGLALLMTGAVLLAGEVTLGLAVNPRYLDFPWAALTIVAVACALLAPGHPPRERVRAERALATVWLICAARILWVESISNWQAVALATALAGFGLTLARVRRARD